MPSATPEELAEAIIDCINAGARVINLSAALTQSSSKSEKELEQTLDYATLRGVILVAAAGNQGMVGSSAVTRHPSVIPVAACDLQARPLSESNLGSSIGRRGLMAPGVGIIGLGTDGKSQMFGGTSAAAPFVTGAIALLWSEFPSAKADQIKLAVTQAGRPRRPTVIPPLLDAWAAYHAMHSSSAGSGSDRQEIVTEARAHARLGLIPRGAQSRLESSWKRKVQRRIARKNRSAHPTVFVFRDS
jgi:hypothetical protein